MRLHRYFFYLTILLLPTQLGVHFWPDWAMVLGRRIDYLSPTIFLTDVTIVFTLLFWLLNVSLRARQQSGEAIYVFNKIASSRTPRNDKLHNFNPYTGRQIPNSFVIFVGLVALVVFIVLNVVLAASPYVAFYKWLKIFEFILFGFYIVKTKPDLRLTFHVLLITIFYSSLIAIFQFILQHSLGGIFWFLGERTFDINTPGIARIQGLFPSFLSMNHELLRPYATFPHPNVLGGFLAVTLPLLLYSLNLSLRGSRRASADKAILGMRNRLPRRQNGLAMTYMVTTIVPGCVALFLTFSRSAWVAFIILLIVSKLSRSCHCEPKAKQSIQGSLAMTLFMIILAIFILVITLPYFKNLTLDNESIFVRTELNSAAISMWWNSSSNVSRLFGVGLGNFLVNLPTYYPSREIFFLQPVHNIYLLILAETGIIGGLFFLWGLWKIVKIVICDTKNVIRKTNIDVSHLTFHVSLVALLLLGLVDHYPLTLQQGQLLLVLFFFLVLQYQHGDEKSCCGEHH